MSSGAQALVDGRTVDLGDLPVALRASDLERGEAIVSVVGDLAPHTGAPQLELTYGDVGPSVPTEPPTETYGPLCLWRDGDMLHLSYADRVSATATSRGLVVGGSDTDLSDAWRYIFHFAVPHVLALHDRFVLHAGGIVSDGSAHLVFGESGAGKSTLVLAALDAGWSALSDDLVVLRQRDSVPKVCGIGKPFRVPSDVLDPESDAPTWSEDDPRRRWVVDGYAWETAWFPVHGSIAVSHADGPRAHVDELTGVEVTSLVLGSFVALAEPQHVRRLLASAAAVGRRGGVRLHHAADASVRLREAARVLEQVKS